MVGHESQPATLMLGDEAVAWGARDAGASHAYGYPGTPSTEILEALVTMKNDRGRPLGAWCTNEKTAYEAALGACMVGRRVLVTMKHVGLNVAADAFVNSALLPLHGGLVIAVADDPGMHSSQNEQDSRFYADFARIPYLEPDDPQACYDLTREAFQLSEELGVPVMLRLVTRLAHARGPVTRREAVAENPPREPEDRSAWVLLPNIARKRWRELLDRQPAMRAWSEKRVSLNLNEERRELGIISCGIARRHLAEVLGELGWVPSWLHLDGGPLPESAIRKLFAHVDRVLVLEDGQPFVERRLRGVLADHPVEGRENGRLPRDGELTPDLVRRALGLPERPRPVRSSFVPPARPPQLCHGCPHRDAYHAIHLAIEAYPTSLVTGDIGCYTLGALPPFSAIESCVCMGASIGMARGAADSGFGPVLAVIGDSTFLHSGMTAIVDAVASRANITVLILDNSVIAMTGIQETMLPPPAFRPLLLGLGVDPEHLHVMSTTPARVKQVAEIIRGELDHAGPSVIVLQRECVESVHLHHHEAQHEA